MGIVAEVEVEGVFGGGVGVVEDVYFLLCGELGFFGNLGGV